MATSDKHCQTFCVKNPKIAETADREFPQVMYDETVPVENAREIESPPNSDDDEVVKSAMSKFNPPVRHTARHDFDSETESESEPEKFLNNLSEEDLVSFLHFVCALCLFTCEVGRYVPRCVSSMRVWIVIYGS